MTIDQLLTLLAVLAWPVVALIISLSVSSVCRTAMAISKSWRETFERDVDRERTYQNIREEKWVVLWSSVMQSTLPALVRACAPVHREATLETAERALLTVLAANGGIPGKRSDEAVRQLVREVRKMYDELQSPTPEPPIVERERGDGASEEDELLEGLFGPAITDDDIEDVHAEFTEED